MDVAHRDFQLLTVEEAATLLRVSVHTIRSWVLRKKIPHLHVGRRVFFNQTELIEWVRRSNETE